MQGGGIALGRRGGQIAAKCVIDLTPATDRSEWGGPVQPLNPADDREISLARIWPVLLWTLGLGGALVSSAGAQNLDAGKPPSQIFAEGCANCHRSVRDFKNGVSVSFLREHYTTSSDMASTMAAYLAGVRSDPRSASPAPKSNGTTAATPREPPATENPRDRRTQQSGDSKPAPQTGDPKAASQAGDPKATPPGSSRTRPGTARAEAAKPGTAGETKPPAAAPPALEEFEE
jgi:hypothetical protein